jgi:Xaa-Pro aminopeptidase
MIQKRLSQLREEMQRLNLKAYILTNNDPHQSEYVPNHYKVREYFSGFSGSVGTLVVLLESASLWVDGRFDIHAAKEVEGNGIDVFVTKKRVSSSCAKWLEGQLKEGDFVGLDGRTMPYKDYKIIEAVLKPRRITLKPQIDFIDLIWEDRPKLDAPRIVIQPIEFAVVTPYEKLQAIQMDMEAEHVDYYIVSDLNDIAWLTNLRGRQIPQNPLFYAFFLIGKHESILFTELKGIDKVLYQHLSENRILLQDYHDIESFVKSLKRTSTVLSDDTKTSVWLMKALPSEIRLAVDKDVIGLKRAIKHPRQIEHSKTAQMRECVYMYQYIYWLKHKRSRGLLNEFTAIQTYHDARKKHPLYYDDCFHMISAFRENGALMHYNPQIDPKFLRGAGFYLINTGAHYYDGTTDLARTLFLGKANTLHKRHYTAILKAHIGIATARFVKGTTGVQLDILARQHIWALGLDYHCSTGHGIGYMQAIHEEPHNISTTPHNVPLEVGMLLTLEPGIYIAKAYGMRVENIVNVCLLEDNGSEVFYGFEMMSYCPFERTLIDREMLTEKEIQWIDDYHDEAFRRLKTQLKPEEMRALRRDTLPL